MHLVVVLAKRANCRVSSGSSSTGTQTVSTGLTTRTTRTVGNGAVLPPKTCHFKFTILAPIKYLSSERITTWSVCRLCGFSHPFASRFHICNLTSIRWVTIINPPISLRISHYFTTTQQISVGLQIKIQEVKKGQKLNNLRIEYVMIRSKLKYLIGDKGVGTVYLELRSRCNPAKYPQLNVWSGWQTRQDKAGWVFGRVLNRTERNCPSKPEPLGYYPDPLRTLLGGCNRTSLEMHLEAEIVTFKDALGGHDRASLELDLEAVIEQVWKCTWRP